MKRSTIYSKMVRHGLALQFLLTLSLLVMLVAFAVHFN